MPAFARYIGIDYSGAAQPDSPLPGLRIYVANADNEPRKISPTDPRKTHWSRRAVFEWLRDALAQPVASLVGIDHAFSFPLDYFNAHSLPRHWPTFLADFCAHWPTDQTEVSVEQIRRGEIGQGDQRAGNARWKRLTEQGIGAKSVFHFDVPGSVAKSTHAGLPWLQALRQHHAQSLHCWPFDGWQITPGCSAIAEIYPSLWSAHYPRADRSPDEHDAYVVAASLQQYDRNDMLAEVLRAPASRTSGEQAAVEGWILGV